MRGWADRDQRHPVLWADLIDERSDLFLGFIQARRLDVAGLHRRGHVEQHDRVLRKAGARGQHRLNGGRHQHRGGQQLKQQKPAEAQSLPGHIGLPIAHLVGPEVQRGHDPGRPADPQKVQRDDRRQSQSEECGRGREERHESSPSRRRVRRTMSSIGWSDESRAKRRPRRCADLSISWVRRARAST